MGGSAISANSKAVGIGAENITTTTKAHLVLPPSHYTLMIDKWFDEASITSHGWTDLGSGNGTAASDVLGVNAVLGIIKVQDECRRWYDLDWWCQSIPGPNQYEDCDTIG